MKRIKKLLFIILSFIIIPNVANAASGSINITGSGTAIKGNSVTVTVSLRTDVALGSWQMDLKYDKSYLQLVKTTSESGGTSMSASYPNNQNKEKSYTFTFKALKTGTTTVKVTGFLAYAFDDMKEIPLTSNGKSIRIMTQEELEATYSSDATLKSITLSKGELTPEFKRTTYTYNVEVENDVTNIQVTGTRNDGNASVIGNGTYDLEEGDNKIEIRVVAQKGNEQTYTINVYRKELDPIEIKKDGKTYKIVRKADSLKNSGTFKETTITIQDTEIPALISEYTNITIVGVKDEDGEIKMYIYDNGLKDEYREFADNQTSIIPLELKTLDNVKHYKSKEFNIKNIKVTGYYLPSNEDQIIIYAKDTTSGKDNYYLYDLLTDTFGVYRFTLDDLYQKQIKMYTYIIYGCGGVIFILLLIAIFKKGKRKENNNIEPQVKPILEETKNNEFKEVKEENKKIDLIKEIPEAKEEMKEEVVDKKAEKLRQKEIKKEKKKNPRSEFDFDIDFANMKIDSDNDYNDKESRDDATREINIIESTNKKMTKKEKKLAKEQQKLLNETKKKKK